MYYQDLYRTNQALGVPPVNGISENFYNWPNYSSLTPNPMTQALPLQNTLGYGVSPYLAGYNRPQYLSAAQPAVNNIDFAERTILRERLDLLQAQLLQITEMLRRANIDLYGRNLSFNSHMPVNGLNQTNGFTNSFTNYAGAADSRLGRLRESETHIFWELSIPGLSLHDLDIEVSGNRIIARTRLPVHPNSRWWNTGVATRGFELFELPDGRVEFNWVVPVAFDAKEVEATCREDFFSICVPKSEVTQRQVVQITKESVGVSPATRKNGTTGKSLSA